MAIKIDDGDGDKIVAEINMTPLIDIMLVLLIIFMVTSSIALESGLDIDIPKTKSKTAAKEGQAVLVSLDAKGSISVEGRKVPYDQLEDAIGKALKSSGSTQVVLEGDQSSRLGDTIRIMDIAKSAGASKFAIAAQEE